jgi:hypothetical protein
MTWLPIGLASFGIDLPDTIYTLDTVDVMVSALDMFGNVTDSLLPRNIILEANRAGVTFPGETHHMRDAVEAFPTVASSATTGLIISAADIINPGIYGDSDPVVVLINPGVEDAIVSSLSVKFGSGDIVYSVGEEDKVEIKVYNKVGMEVGTLASGVKGPGHYKASLKALNLASDVYFVVMNGPGNFTKRVKAALVK